MSDLLRHYNRELIRVTCRNTALSTALENINELSNPFLYAGSAFEQITFPNDNSFWFDEKTDIFFRGLSSTAAGTITVDALLRSVRN